MKNEQLDGSAMAWSNLYSFKSQMSSLLQMYLENTSDPEVSIDVSHRLKALIQKYEPDVEGVKFKVRNKSWSDVYPKLSERLRARLAYFLTGSTIIRDLKWYHVLLGFKIWSDIDMTRLAVSDIISTVDHRDELRGRGTDLETLLIEVIEKGIRISPIGVLETPSGCILCETCCKMKNGDNKTFSISLNI